ncbi:HNH endonuclease [Patescibacteria group bacterium]
MKNIFPYSEIVSQEGFNIQKGMNYRPRNKHYSIFLMSLRANAPYNDGFDGKGKNLVYEGEDISRREHSIPKKKDQSLFTKSGKLTNNGHFFKAAEDYKLGRREKPEKIKVYEKISNNVWADKGWFSLVDAIYRFSKQEKRKVFKFILEPLGLKKGASIEDIEEFEFSRRIPTDVKRKVWERDKGRCIECGATKGLHFDHIIPWSKGGSSTILSNIQILCEKHNLGKSDKIQ